MKKAVRPPRFLPEVLQAIYELKETGGSNSNKIFSHVKSTLNNEPSYSAPRNLSTQVRRALNHAATNGIVRQRAGKFRINIGILDPFKDCAECRRRKRQAKRRRGRGRRHAIHPRARGHRHYGSESESLKCSGDSDSDGFPVRQLRRRRRKGGKRRRRRRRAADHAGNDVAKRTNVDEFNKDEYPDDHKGGDENVEDNRQCDNPECLCNVKEEIEEVQNMDSSM